MKKVKLKKLLRSKINLAYKGLAVAFMFISLWMILAPLDSAFAVSAVLRIKGKSIAIDHPYGGIIEKIQVDENIKVNKNDFLMKLDAHNAYIDRDFYKKQLEFLYAAEERIKAEKENYNLSIFNHSNDVAHDLENENLKWEHQKFLFNQNSRQAEITSLNADLQRQKLKKHFIEERITLKQEEDKIFENLISKGLAKLTDKNIIATELQNLQYNNQQVEKEINAINNSIANKKQELENLKSEDDNRILSEEGENITSVKEAAEKLELAHDIVEKSVIYTPTNGYISGLRFYTTGAYIPPNEVILEITPKESEVILEAKIPNENIIYAKIGKQVNIQLSNFKMDLIPKVSGEIVYIAANSISEQNSVGALEDVYLMQIKINQEDVKKLDEKVELKAGMPATVFISKGENNVYNMLKTFVQNITSKAFKEG